jgi:LDH2 family malate/lactate/ureidoglycolate dehydrogenase
MPFLDGQVLRDLIGAQLAGRGVAAAAAADVARSLVETSLRGVDSHGIHLLPYYVSAVGGGRINGRADVRVVARRAAAATVDADRAFGHHAGSVAMRLAVEMAAASGAAVVGVRQSTHFGAAAYFALQAARQGCAAFAFTNADALVKASGASEAFFGTNPICFAAPIEGEDPFCLDMATSRVSWNKIINQRRRREPLPPGWASDGAGAPTTDPERARMLEPSGEYKGYGLGMMVDILCAGFMDGPFGKDILPMYGSGLTESRSISHCFMAIDVSAFVDAAAFARRMRALAERIRGLPPRDTPGVMVPGDPEKRAFSERSLKGIPIDDDRYAELLSVSAEFAAARRP